MTATAIEVRERPILFSAPMVRALLDGRKTQTRRVVKWQDAVEGCEENESLGNWVHDVRRSHPCDYTCTRDPFELCPYGAPGDRLWVRETWTAEFEWIPAPGQSQLVPWHRTPRGWRGVKNAQRIYFAADDLEADVYANDDGTCDMVTTGERAGDRRWAPSIHMPRWASRITLELTGVHVERVQDITNSDAIAEGMPADASVSPREIYADLWDDLNAKRGFGWDVNPWVWVLTFARVGGAA